jgi:transcriptional regulator with XRE-family HTH domain
LLGKRLKHLRIYKGLYQKELAKLLNISTSAYGYYEQGKRDPDTRTLQILSEFYNVSTDYLLGKTDDPTPIGQPKIDIGIDQELDQFIQRIQETSGLKLYGEPLDDGTKTILLKMLKNTKEMVEEIKKNQSK